MLVVDLHEQAGGAARTMELTLPGFKHDLCSTIHPMARTSPAFEGLDIDWVEPPAELAHPLDDAPAAVMYRDLRATAEALDDPSWEAAFAPYVPRWKELSADAMGRPGLPSSPLLLARFGISAPLSARQWASRLKTERARALYAGVAAHGVVPFDNLASSPIGVMLSVVGHASGWPFPRGGAGAITDALLAAFKQEGGELQLGRRISSLDEVDGTVFFCTSPRAMEAICGEALPKGYRKTLTRYRHGPGIFKMDWALSEPVPWKDPACSQAACLHLGGNLEELAVGEAQCWRNEVPDSPYVLTAQHTLFDPTRAPEGKHTLWAYCHTPRGSEVDMTEAIEDQIERFAPGFRDCVLARSTKTCREMEAINPNQVGGDVNGGEATWDQLLTRPAARLNPYSTPNRRVWICSAATPPGGGVHGLGGFHAASAFLGR